MKEKQDKIKGLNEEIETNKNHGVNLFKIIERCQDGKIFGYAHRKQYPNCRYYKRAQKFSMEEKYGLPTFAPAKKGAVLVHIPHDGNIFPKELIKSVVISNEEFIKYHNKMRDEKVGLLVKGFKCIKVKAKVSRLLCDVERFIDDKEIMNKYGMGFCYEKAFDGKTIKKVGKADLEKAKEYYFNHQRKFDRIASRYDKVFILDLHSYSKDLVLKDFVDESYEFPDVCIGYDSDFCSFDFVEKVKRLFLNCGYSVEINYPYRGSYVPNIIYNNKCSTKATSIMLEINKRVYLNNGKINRAAVRKLRKVIKQMVSNFTFK